MKSLIITLLLVGTTITSNLMAAVHEVGIFSIKPEKLESYEKLRPVIKNFLNSQSGYLGIKSYSSIKGNETVFTDIITWKSEELFYQAMENAKKEPFHPIFLDSILQMYFWDVQDRL